MKAAVRAVGFLALVVVAFAVAPIQPVAGFGITPHKKILKDALDDGNTMSKEALDWVTGSIVLGGGNLGSDQPQNQLKPEKHFDSAKNPIEICVLWKFGLNAALERAVKLAAPEGIEKRELDDRQGALEAFGEATHAIADFYAHTNWIELHRVLPPLVIPQAPILGQTCDSGALPQDLQSGYFSPTSLPDFCPRGGPPRGFAYCHKDIAKDSPTTGYGSKEIGAGPTTYHQAAVAVAVKATRSAWQALHDRIVARYSVDPTTDAECVFMKLAWGEERSCRRLWKAEGRIKTHQEYVIPDGRLLHDLDITVEIRLKSQPVEYPGPKNPPVYADVRGSTKQRGTFCQTAITKAGTFRECDPYRGGDTVLSDDARLKVTPKPDPIELDWRVTFPGKKPACATNVIFRLDRNAPTTRPFPNCPGPAPGMESRVRVLTYSGTFKMFPDQP